MTNCLRMRHGGAREEQRCTNENSLAHGFDPHD
jgi:hypothetical protein